MIFSSFDAIIKTPSSGKKTVMKSIKIEHYLLDPPSAFANLSKIFLQGLQTRPSLKSM